MDKQTLTDLSIYNIYMKNIRRKLHQMPELAFSEVKTHNLIMSELMAMKLHPREVGTGIFVDIGEGGSRIAFRADMDALPICETNNTEYKSQTKGLMHACGHDGHMAMLLGLAKYLSENNVNRAVRLVFQPAEEGSGGAVGMIAAGCLENVDSIYALHMAPNLPEHLLGLTEGACMAGAVEFDVEVEGRSAHAAERKTGVDALAVAVQIANILTGVSDEVERSEMLLHVGKISGGTARNIVASSAKIEATFRFFDEQLKEQVMDSIETAIKMVDKQYGTKSKIKTLSTYIPVINGHNATINIGKCYDDIVGLQKIYTAEDFGYYLKAREGAMAWLGCGRNGSTGLHTPTFDFDEDVLLSGLRIYLNLINLEAK